MRMLIGRWFGRGLLLGLAAGLVSCGTHFPPSSGDPAPRVVRQPVGSQRGVSAPADGVDVWVVADPLHTGVVLPLDWLCENGFRAPASVRGERYVNISWGDRVAYEQERWLTPWEVFNALVLRTESVVEVIAFHWDPRQVFPQKRIYHTRIAREQGPSVVAFLNNCGRFDSKGKWIVIGPPTWGKGNLLASPHLYGFPRLCNAFTAGTLEACGYRFGPWSEIWGDALLASCKRQGFERLPDLSKEEIDRIVEFTRAHPQ